MIDYIINSVQQTIRLYNIDKKLDTHLKQNVKFRPFIR